MDEVAHFQASGLPVARPNSMNNYGLILNEIGMEQAMDALQARVLSPVAEALFPAQGGGCLDGHHSFIVQYSEGADLGLDMHTDDSDVTFNVCLGKEFSGAGLQFCGVLGGPSHRKRSLVYHHAKGRCVVHLGAHRHGADDLESGERLNLIIWNHSSLYRSSRAYRWEGRAPGDGAARSAVPVVHSRRGLRAVQEVPRGEGRVREDGVVSPRGGPGEDEMSETTRERERRRGKVKSRQTGITSTAAHHE